MGGFLAIPILGLAAILQASLVPILDLPGGGPNLTFVIVLAWALNAPVGQAALWALLGGLFADLLSIVPLGTSSLG
ncbi:MAG: rod shape-determining protein MreD, partial [Phototrophicaceae bacterium]